MLLYNPAKTFFFLQVSACGKNPLCLRCMTPTDPSSLQPCGILEPRKHISLVPSFHLLREREDASLDSKQGDCSTQTGTSHSSVVQETAQINTPVA